MRIRRTSRYLERKLNRLECSRQSTISTLKSLFSNIVCFNNLKNDDILRQISISIQIFDHAYFQHTIAI